METLLIPNLWALLDAERRATFAPLAADPLRREFSEYVKAAELQRLQSFLLYRDAHVQIDVIGNGFSGGSATWLGQIMGNIFADDTTALANLDAWKAEGLVDFYFNAQHPTIMVSVQSLIRVTTSPLASHMLTVSTTNAGTALVESIDGKISCGAACQASFQAGTPVTLVARETPTSQFVRWTGACSSTSGPICTFNIESDANVGVEFQAATPALYPQLFSS